MAGIDLGGRAGGVLAVSSLSLMHTKLKPCGHTVKYKCCCRERSESQDAYDGREQESDVVSFIQHHHLSARCRTREPAALDSDTVRESLDAALS